MNPPPFSPRALTRELSAAYVPNTGTVNEKNFSRLRRRLLTGCGANRDVGLSDHLPAQVGRTDEEAGESTILSTVVVPSPQPLSLSRRTVTISPTFQSLDSEESLV